LEEINLQSLTVTINAIDPDVAGKIYSFILYHGKKHTGAEAGRVIIANQLEGVKRAVEYGMTVKVNTVLIPGVNDDQIPLIAEQVKELGAFVMNVMPLIPQAEFSHVEPPSPEHLDTIRNANEKIIGQFKHCRQCRADAIGLIGQDINSAFGGCAVPAGR
jgi:nitrogen fixation protein NifB